VGPTFFSFSLSLLPTTPSRPPDLRRSHSPGGAALPPPDAAASFLAVGGTTLPPPRRQRQCPTSGVAGVTSSAPHARPVATSVVGGPRW
jgi:hypothetical protein